MDFEWLWAPFRGCFLAQEEKIQFPRLVAFPCTKLAAIPLHSQGINYLNQFLEELNDWIHNPKWVVGGLWVFSLTHGLTPLAQGFE